MDFDVTVIGAGVVGLAITARLSEIYSSVLLVEKNKKFGQETSSRNSEVMHSGIYYPSNSLKAMLCVQGNAMLYRYCDEKNIPYNKCGKLIIASENSKIDKLESIYNSSKANGVNDGIIISKSEIEKIQPNISAEMAIFYPSTGIIDSHNLMIQLEHDCILNGSSIAYNNKVMELEKIIDGYKVVVQDNIYGSSEFTSKIVINSSGLNSYAVSSLIGLNDEGYRLQYWKGEYFSVGNGKNKLINKLIYPLPNSNITGLGIHATIDLNNGLKLGPNAIYIGEKFFDYYIDENNLYDFFLSAKKFLPFLEKEDLRPDQVGIRPKLQKPGEGFKDFIISNEFGRGYSNFINLIGIESPGLTSCLAIAEYVEKLIIKE